MKKNKRKNCRANVPLGNGMAKRQRSQHYRAGFTEIGLTEQLYKANKKRVSLCNKNS
jgi:hypothetical protein